MAALLAIASSLLWGAGDFFGGRASRTFSTIRVLAWSQLATLIAIWAAVAVAAVFGSVDIELRTLAIGAAGGCAGIIGLGAFYQALANGPMAVVPPIAASGVALPVIVGLASGAAPSNLTMVGLVVAVIGVVLSSIGTGGAAVDGTPGQRIALRTLGLCLIAACGFALIFVALDTAAGDSAGQALIATAGARIGSFTTIALVVLGTRTHPGRGVSPRAALGFVGIGLLDTSANLVFAIASTLGQLEVVAVLGSLYPAVTSGLAHVVLGERLGRIQFAGVACALAGFVLLASG